DYAVPFFNSVVLDTDDPAEINIALEFLRSQPQVVKRLREEAQQTARRFRWENIVKDNLLGKLAYVALRQLVKPPADPNLATSSVLPNGQPESAGLSDTENLSRDLDPTAAADPSDKMDPPGDRPADDPASGDPPEPPPSLAYGGESVSRRLAIRPQVSAPLNTPVESPGDPAGAQLAAACRGRKASPNCRAHHTPRRRHATRPNP
ncbi:MAG: hypothetical protein H5T84_06640, partial [Thermoleophilia bacterium]|nr:hypothetical protein [Thermoleophilia bacterium]